MNRDISGGEAAGVVGPERRLPVGEPTGALDTAAGVEILRLSRTRCDGGAVVPLAIHEPWCAGWAARVVFLADGELAGSTSMSLGGAW
ncbi:hypothetical protein [Nonomuraea zeae]|uniref:hypothetical protein n=1 Tax=Nonomuraea zeae TaxID=1642303 RepID=UPI0036060B22